MHTKDERQTEYTDEETADEIQRSDSNKAEANDKPVAIVSLTTGQVIRKYKFTLIAMLFSVLTFAVAINLVPILFVPLAARYGLAFGNLGLLIAVSFGAQIIVLGTCSKLPDKLGMRPVFIATGSMAAAGFLLLFLAPVFFPPNLILAGLILAVIVYGIGAGFAVTLTNPLINNLPFKQKEKTLTIFHAIFALVILIAIVGTTLGIHAVSRERLGDAFNNYQGWNFIPLIWTAIPLTAVILWIFAPIVQPKPAPRPLDIPLNKKESGAVQNGTALLGKNVKNRKWLLWVMLIAMTAAMASEAIVAKGSSSYIDVGLNVPKLIGDLLGPALFAVALGLGRLLYGLLGNERNMRNLMIFGSLACFMLYLVAVFTPIPALGVAALVLCGFTVSLLLPGLLAQTGNEFKDMGVKVFVWLATASKIGAAGGPALFGLLGGLLENTFPSLSYQTGLGMEALGLRAALLICAVFPLMSFVLQLVLKRGSKKHT